MGQETQETQESQGGVAIAQLIDKELVLFDVKADSKEDLIRQMAACAQEHGYAVDGYAEDVIEREATYPTALPTQVMKVAVPHAMVQDHVLRPAIVVARLAHPVTFKEMGDGVNDVAVEMAFMLVAKGDKSHLKVLQKLIGMLADAEELRVLQAITDPDVMVHELIEHLA